MANSPKVPDDPSAASQRYQLNENAASRSGKPKLHCFGEGTLQPRLPLEETTHGIPREFLRRIGGDYSWIPLFLGKFTHHPLRAHPMCDGPTAISRFRRRDCQRQSMTENFLPGVGEGLGFQPSKKYRANLRVEGPRAATHEAWVLAKRSKAVQELPVGAWELSRFASDRIIWDRAEIATRLLGNHEFRSLWSLVTDILSVSTNRICRCRKPTKSSSLCRELRLSSFVPPKAASDRLVPKIHAVRQRLSGVRHPEGPP